MPKRFNIDTFGISEAEIRELEMPDLVILAKSRGLKEVEIEALKNYRRLLKVRTYGKDFRKRERFYMDRLREEKRVWEREAAILRQEIEWYKEQSSVLEAIELLDIIQTSEFNPHLMNPYFI